MSDHIVTIMNSEEDDNSTYMTNLDIDPEARIRMSDKMFHDYLLSMSTSSKSVSTNPAPVKTTDSVPPSINYVYEEKWNGYEHRYESPSIDGLIELVNRVRENNKKVKTTTIIGVVNCIG